MLRWSTADPGPRGRVVRALTSRAGGVSRGPWAGLDLAEHVGDDPDDVAENRRRLAAVIGVPVERLVVARQVHGAGVETVHGPWPAGPPEADALVTGEPGTVLAVLVADCVPVMMVAPDEGLVAVAHAGRRGLVAAVVPATLERMRSLGAGRVLATIGPSVCGACYEVPAELRDEVAADHPVTATTTRWGTPGLDVAAGVHAQLLDAGAEVGRVPGCTFEDPDLYSYRRDGVTGRFAGLAWLDDGSLR